MTNPFKFGSVVDDPFFTNRVEELEKVKQILESNNHLVMISGYVWYESETLLF